MQHWAIDVSMKLFKVLFFYRFATEIKGCFLIFDIGSFGFGGVYLLFYMLVEMSGKLKKVNTLPETNSTST